MNKAREVSIFKLGVWSVGGRGTLLPHQQPLLPSRAHFETRSIWLKENTCALWIWALSKIYFAQYDSCVSANVISVSSWFCISSVGSPDPPLHPCGASAVQRLSCTPREHASLQRKPTTSCNHLYGNVPFKKKLYSCLLVFINNDTLSDVILFIIKDLLDSV